MRGGLLLRGSFYLSLIVSSLSLSPPQAALEKKEQELNHVKESAQSSFDKVQELQSQIELTEQKIQQLAAGMSESAASSANSDGKTLQQQVFDLKSALS